MMPKKQARQPAAPIKPLNMTPEQLKQTILDGVASVGSDGQGKDGLQGYLAKIACENPKLANDARSYARHFAEAGYGPPIVSDGGRGEPPSPAAREGSQQTLAQVVIETLGEVQGRDGDRAAYQLAVGNIRASAHFLLHSIGPQAARRALAETGSALEEDIKLANANSAHMQ
jgi:hypothetical protein